MLDQKQFGIEIKKLRLKRGENITELAKKLGVDRSYISKIENGHEKPPLPLLNSLFSHYSLTEETARHLVAFIHENAGGLVLAKEPNRKEVTRMDEIPNIAVNLTADRTPILYTDSVYITSNPYGIILNIAQSVDEKNQQIVARVGMSRDHAKALQEVLSKHLALTHSNKVKQ